MAQECHALRKAFVTVLHCYRSGSTQFLSLLTLPPSQMRMNPAAVRSKCLLNDRNRWLLRLPYARTGRDVLKRESRIGLTSSPLHLLNFVKQELSQITRQRQLRRFPPNCAVTF